MGQDHSRPHGSWRPSAGLREAPARESMFQSPIARPNKFAERLSFAHGSFSYCGETIGIFQMLVRLFLYVFREQCNAFRVFQNIHLYALLPDQILRARKIRNIPDDQAAKLTPVDKRRADFTSAERRKHRGPAEIQAPRIPRS